MKGNPYSYKPRIPAPADRKKKEALTGLGTKVRSSASSATTAKRLATNPPTLPKTRDSTAPRSTSDSSVNTAMASSSGNGQYAESAHAMHQRAQLLNMPPGSVGLGTGVEGYVQYFRPGMMDPRLHGYATGGHPVAGGPSSNPGPGYPPQPQPQPQRYAVAPPNVHPTSIIAPVIDYIGETSTTLRSDAAHVLGAVGTQTETLKAEIENANTGQMAALKALTDSVHWLQEGQKAQTQVLVELVKKMGGIEKTVGKLDEADVYGFDERDIMTRLRGIEYAVGDAWERLRDGDADRAVPHNRKTTSQINTQDTPIDVDGPPDDTVAQHQQTPAEDSQPEAPSIALELPHIPSVATASSSGVATPMDLEYPPDDVPSLPSVPASPPAIALAQVEEPQAAQEEPYQRSKTPEPDSTRVAVTLSHMEPAPAPEPQPEPPREQTTAKPSRQSTCSLTSSTSTPQNFSRVDWSSSSSQGQTKKPSAVEVFHPDTEILNKSASRIRLADPIEGSVAELRFGVVGCAAYVGNEPVNAKGEFDGRSAVDAEQARRPIVRRPSVSPLPSPETSRENTPAEAAKGKGKEVVVGEEEEDELEGDGMGMDGVEDGRGQTSMDVDADVDEQVHMHMQQAEPAELVLQSSTQVETQVDADMDGTSAPAVADSTTTKTHLPTPPPTGTDVNTPTAQSSNNTPILPTVPSSSSSFPSVSTLQSTTTFPSTSTLPSTSTSSALPASNVAESASKEKNKAVSAPPPAQMELDVLMRDFAANLEEFLELEVQRERIEREIEVELERRASEEAEKGESESPSEVEEVRVADASAKSTDLGRQASEEGDQGVVMDQIDQQRSSSPTGRAGMAEEEDELAADLELATDNRSPTLLLADEDSQKEEEDVEKQHEGEGVSGFGEGTLADIMTSTPKASRTDSSLMGRPSFDLSSLPPLFQPIPIPSPPARLEVDRSRSRSRSVSETPLEVEDVSGGSGGVQGEEDADMTHTQQLQAQIEFLPPPPSSPSEAWDDEDEDRGDTWGVNEGDADNEEDELVLEEEDATAITTGAEANALSDNDDPHGLFGGENDDDTLGDMAVQATPASQQDKDQIGEVDNQDEPEENLFLPGDEEKDDDDEPPLPPPRKLKPARMPSPSSSSSSSSSEGEGPSKKSWTAPAKKSLPAPDSPVSAPLLIDVSESKGSNSSKKATIAPHTPGRTRKRNQSNASSSTLMLGDLSRSASPAKRKMENSHAASRTLVRTPTRNTTTGSSMWGPSASKISKANSTGSVQKKVVPVKAEDVIEISSSPEPSPRSVVQAQINRRKEKLLEKRKVKEEGAKGKIKEEGPKGTIKEEGVKGKIKVEVNKGKEKEKEKAGSSKGKPTASANTSAGPVIDLTSDVDNDDDDEHGMVPTPTPTPAPDVKAKGKGRLPAKVADADSGSEVSFSSDSDDSVDYVKARPAPKAGVPKPAPTQSRITDRVKSKSARSAAETRVKRPPKRSMTGEDDDDADLRPLKRAREMSSKADTFHPVIKTQKTQKSIATMQPSNRPLTQAKRKERDTDDDEPAPRGRFKKPSSSVASSSRKSEPGTSPTRSLRGRTVDLKAEKVKWPKANQHGTKEFQRELIECDLCKVWYHYGCVDIKENDVRIQGSEEFRCPACKAGVVQSHISEEDKENGKCGRPNCNHGPLKRKEYFVEKIVGRKLNPYGKGHTWLVKWDGWDITAASWVEEDGLGEPARIIKRFEDDAKKEQKGRLLANPMETVLLKEVEESQWVDPGYYK